MRCPKGNDCQMRVARRADSNRSKSKSSAVRQTAVTANSPDTVHHFRTIFNKTMSSHEQLHVLFLIALAQMLTRCSITLTLLAGCSFAAPAVCTLRPAPHGAPPTPWTADGGPLASLPTRTAAAGTPIGNATATATATETATSTGCGPQNWAKPIITIYKTVNF